MRKQRDRTRQREESDLDEVIPNDLLKKAESRVKHPLSFEFETRISGRRVFVGYELSPLAFHLDLNQKAVPYYPVSLVRLSGWPEKKDELAEAGSRRMQESDNALRKKDGIPEIPVRSPLSDSKYHVVLALLSRLETEAKTHLRKSMQEEETLFACYQQGYERGINELGLLLRGALKSGVLRPNETKYKNWVIELLTAVREDGKPNNSMQMAGRAFMEHLSPTVRRAVKRKTGDISNKVQMFMTLINNPRGCLNSLDLVTKFGTHDEVKNFVKKSVVRHLANSHGEEKCSILTNKQPDGSEWYCLEKARKSKVVNGNKAYMRKKRDS